MIIGGIFSIALYFLVQITIVQAAIIFLGSVIIDFDHVIFYYLRKKKNPFDAYKWFSDCEKKFKKLSEKQKEKYEKPLIIFHGMEFWFLVMLLSLIDSIFLWFLIGIAIHIILDFIEMIHNKEPFYTKFSQIYVTIKNKDKKKL